MTIQARPAPGQPVPAKLATGDQLGPISEPTRDQQRHIAAVVVDRLGDGDEAREVIAALLHPGRRTKLYGSDKPGLRACGTEAAYERHLRAGEEPCKACRDAAAAKRRGRHRTPTAAGGAA